MNDTQYKGGEGGTSRRRAPHAYHRVYQQPGAFALKASAPDPEAPKRCSVFGCGRPTERFAGKGLSYLSCRYHTQFRSRHGSYHRASFTASDLADHRKTVARYLRALEGGDDPWLASAERCIGGLLWGAGSAERPVDTLAMKPSEKARQAFARLGDKGIPARRVLARCLAVELACGEDADPEFRHVQLAKAIMRLAGGHRYDKVARAPEDEEPRNVQFAKALMGVPTRLPPFRRYGVYLRSSGLVLRHVGIALSEAISSATEHHIARLRDCEQIWYGA